MTHRHNQGQPALPQSGRFSRRDALRAALVGGGAVVGAPLLRLGQPQAQPVATRNGADDTRFLIVVCGSGGASIIDGPLAVKESECPTPQTLNCFPDALVTEFDGSPFRAIDYTSETLGPIPQSFMANQTDFVSRHRNQMMVSTWTRTSVNHAVGQARAVTGNDAWRGRTLQELVAAAYGASFALPNVHLMSGSGFTRRGLDETLPSYAFGEQVADPRFWPLSLDGSKGIPGAPARSTVAKARALRDRLEKQSLFQRVFGGSERLVHWQHQRGAPQLAIEAENLIDKLIVAQDSAEFPLSAYGLQPAPEAETLLEVFPNLGHDPFEAQAALAFLLIKNRLSVTVTIGPSFNVAIAEGVDFQYGGGFGGGFGGGGGGGANLPEGAIKNPPIAFDFSHQDHRAVQQFMWSRVYSVMDRLIGLLAKEEWKDGESIWDRTMMHVATDFGRTRNRPAGAPAFGSGHDLNNGVLTVSPLVRGGALLGGVDPKTTLTYGFDPQSGEPDPGRNMEEREIFSGLVQALGIDTSGAGLPDMPAMRKGG
jgi:hypothetical protein